MRRSGRTIRSRQRGQAFVEFLMSALFLLLTIFGAVQLIVIVYTYVTMAQAAKAGVRYAIVHGSDSGLASGPSNTTGVENAVKYYADYPGMTITVSYPDGNNNPPNRVRVQLNYPFSLFPLGWALPTVRAAAEGRIMY
jgi:Flp pilus assembly protein TadG